jgi:hypothetical protein
MRRLLVLASLCGIASSVLAQPQPSLESSLLVRNVSVIDGTGAAPRPGLDVMVRNGRISQMGVSLGEPADITVDGRGLFLMPGLTDAHVHLSGMPWAERAEQLRRVLRGGVTMVYDVASDLRNTSDLSRAALVNEIESPAIYYAALFAGPPFFTDPRVVATSRGYKP